MLHFQRLKRRSFFKKTQRLISIVSNNLSRQLILTEKVSKSQVFLQFLHNF